MKRLATESRSKTAPTNAANSTASLRYAAFLVLGVAFLTAFWATVHTHHIPEQARSAEALRLPTALMR
jgi:hypothetical protein